MPIAADNQAGDLLTRAGWRGLLTPEEAAPEVLARAVLARASQAHAPESEQAEFSQAETAPAESCPAHLRDFFAGQAASPARRWQRG